MSQFGFLSNLSFSLVTAVATIVAAGVIGALASALPGVQAARMGIVEALRRQE
jgi:ABC-type lipoprotein release transport system permease subunit